MVLRLKITLAFAATALMAEADAKAAMAKMTECK
jgi:hypothetical protein